MKCYSLEEARAAADEVTGLYLHHCGLEELPPVIFSMPKLTDLHIKSNPLKQISQHIGKLKQLRTLSLTDNQLQTLPKELFTLSKLEKLDLSGNQLTKIPSSVSALSSLRTLLLNHNQISGLPKETGRLYKLERLEASHNQIRSIPASLRHMLNLRRLILSHNQIRTFPILLCRLQHLERLDISYNRLAGIPEEIAQLHQLDFLSLERNNIKALPPGLGDLHQLRQLIVNRNKLTAIPSFIWELPWLAVLEANRNAITSLSGQLEKARRLESLQLAENQLHSIPQEVIQLQQLRRLDLSGNLLRQLPDLPASLMKLSLDDNLLEQIPSAVYKLQRLQLLSMRNCRIVALPDAFKQLSVLETLDLQGNRISHIPAPLFQLKHLRELKGTGNAESRKGLLRFTRICNSRDVPASMRKLLYEVLQDADAALPYYTTRQLLQALSVGFSDVAYSIRMHLLQTRSPVQEIDLRQPGKRVLLLGETGFEAAKVNKLLAKHGLQLVTAEDQGADYIVLGRLLKLHKLPPLQEKQCFISRLSLTQLLDRELGRKLPGTFTDSQLEKLRLMIFHREEKNRKLALQLLESGGVPTPLLTDLFVAWKLGHEPRRTYERLLLQNCSEEALRNLYATLGLRGYRNARQLATHIYRYTHGNELDGDRMMELL